MRPCPSCERPLLTSDCPFCHAPVARTGASRRWTRMLGAVMTPLVLGACYGAPPCEPHDEDGDGYDDCYEDCDPRNPDIHPGAAEICDDGIDNDCDGIAASSDGVEVCGNGFDDDCDGEVDEPAETPGIERNCFDGRDDDCDGLSDADDPDCVDRGSVRVEVSFDGDQSCEAAEVTTLALLLDNGRGTRTDRVGCGDLAWIDAAAGELTLTVHGEDDQGQRTWSAEPLTLTMVAGETIQGQVTLSPVP